MSDLIKRQGALTEARPEYLNPSQQDHESYNHGWNDAISAYYTGIKMLPPYDTVIDCSGFIKWILDEIMDEENWELNAVANGEIIARKLKKLGLLEVKDGYYVRTQLVDAALLDIERWRTWSHTYDNMCQERPKVSIPEPCKKCSNHPSNGGSGICHCILGNNIIKW